MSRQIDSIFHISKRLITILILTMALTAWAAPKSMPPKLEAVYDGGVTAYRNGNYEKALQDFQQITKDVPESVEGHYYLAITLAQLGRFKEAQESYNNVIKLAPNSDAAKLAQEGITYLPPPQALDVPPRFQNPPNTPTVSSKTSQTTQNQATQNPYGNMDPKTMETMMMMSSMGGGNGGGFNPMMIPMMESMMHQNGNSQNPQDNMSPEVIKDMMMNQMMQNMTPFDSGKNN